MAGEVDSNEINYNQTSQPEIGVSYIDPEDAGDELDIPREDDKEAAAEVPEEALRWSYLDGNYALVEQGASGAEEDDE